MKGIKLEQLYDRKIDRRINPALVVSEMDEYSIKQEIDEYVFTPDITKNIYSFLYAITQKKEGKPGVWVNGYYGSGKTHFIKYLFYCLNSNFKEDSLKNFEDSIKTLDPLDEPTPSQVNSVKKILNDIEVEEIIFNIDKVSGKKDYNDTITKIFLNQLNEFRGYNNQNIALAIYLEKPLDEEGNFGKFKQRILEVFKEKWDGNQHRFVNRYMDKVLDIANEFDKKIDKESLRSAILDKDQDYTIDFLINQLTEYLHSKSDNFRLIFLVDEVSQYIGSSTSLLLNLETIVEEIGISCNNKVWLVCTAQQDLKNLIDNTDTRGADFGKILARFETRISLQSQDASYITKMRVLAKNSDGIGLLTDFYKKSKGDIENLFTFDHDLYHNYDNSEDYLLTYPFISYQFRLISDVFQSFSNIQYLGEGVKNTERSIIGIIHYTAGLCKDQKIGYFVPFDLFFNNFFQKDLTHFARGIIDRAYNIKEINENPFARRVVNILFMISNLGESHSVNFPANVENISLLMMNDLQTGKMELQNKVQKVLDVLINKNIIQASEGKYRFFKEDEIEVANLVRSTSITSDDRWEYIYNDILLKILRINPRVPFGTNTFRMGVKIDDKDISTGGDFTLKFSVYDSVNLDNLAHESPAQDLVIGISGWFMKDEDLKQKILTYVRTQKYIRDHSASVTGTREKTLNNFRETNKVLLDELKKRFSTKLMQTSAISAHQVLTPDQFNGATAEKRLDVIILKHLEEIYKKQHLVANYATSNAELISHAKDKQRTTIKDLSSAEQEAENKIFMEGKGCTVNDIIKKFQKSPFGWRDLATIDVLLALAKNGKRRFEWRSEDIGLEEFVEKALNSRERDAISIYPEKEHTEEEIKEFIALINNEIFAETMIKSSNGDLKTIIESFKLALQPYIEKVHKLRKANPNFPFTSLLNDYHNYLGEIYNARNLEALMAFVSEKKEEIRNLRDDFKQIEEFAKNQIDSYCSISKYIEENKQNFSELPEKEQAKARFLDDYFKNEAKPWDRFPQIKKAHKELKEALNKKLKELKQQVFAKYESIFDELDAKRKELGIDEQNIVTDRINYLEKLRKYKTITKFQIVLLEANDFRKDNLKKLFDHKAREEKEDDKEYVPSVEISIAHEMSPVTIETEEQLDAYLKKLKAKLMVKLKNHKKLFLS